MRSERMKERSTPEIPSALLFELPGPLCAPPMQFHVCCAPYVLLCAHCTRQGGGLKVAPRAGHAAALLGHTLYVVGGGNNVKVSRLQRQAVPPLPCCGAAARRCNHP